MTHLFKKWDNISGKIKNKHVYLFLDFDGTLAAIRRDPAKVRLSREVSDLLNNFVKLQNISIAIVSGRKLSDVKRLAGIKGITYVGNHGLEARGKGIKHIVPGVVKAKKTLKKISGILKKEYRSLKGVSVEDKDLTLCVHFRRASKNNIEIAQDIFKKVTHPYKIKKKIFVTQGKRSWEIRPPIKWDKGKMVMHLLRVKGSKGQRVKVFPIYVGDDRTDEDAFRELKRIGCTIKITGNKKERSLAKYYLNNILEVKKFLSKVYSHKRREQYV